MAALTAPLYLVIAVIVLVPLLYLGYASIRSGAPGDPTAGYTGQNIRTVLTEASYRRVLLNTLTVAGLVTVLATALGSCMAWLVGRTNVPGHRRLELLVPLPLFLSPFAGGVAWVFLGSKSAGLINVAYRWLTGGDGALVNIFSFGGLVFTMVLFMAPYAYLFTLGPLRNMDGSLEEASRVHGGSHWRTLTRVTLPLVLPGMTAALLMIFVLSAEMFSLPSLIGMPAEYYTLPFLIYQATHFSPPNWGLASAAGLVLLLIVIVGVLLQKLATRTSERFVTVSGKGFGAGRVDIGRWRWLGALVCYGYVAVAMVLPIAALLMGSLMRYFTSSFSAKLFTFNNWVRVLSSEGLRSALKNTLIVAAVGPLIGLALAFALSYLWQRLRAPFGRTAETVAMLPVAIPGVVLGVGLVWAFVATPLYGTLGILFVAYVARYLPHSLRIFQSSLVQIHPELDEASRVAGAGIGRTLASVTLPLLRHSALSAWVLLFILMIRELNVAIMVYTPNTTVLPVLLWSEVEAGQYGAAATIAMLEVIIIAVAFVLARRLFRVDLVNTMARGR